MEALAFCPLTSTHPCTTNCLACNAELANIALKTAISSLLSMGAYVCSIYGVSLSALALSLVDSNAALRPFIPAPRPAPCWLPSDSARCCVDMGTTEASECLNMFFHCRVVSFSPWYLRVSFFAVNFCW